MRIRSLFLALTIVLISGCAETGLILEPSGSLTRFATFEVGTVDRGRSYQPMAMTADGIVLIDYSESTSSTAAVLYDYVSGDQIRSFPTPTFNRVRRLRAVAISPDERLLVVAGEFVGYGSAMVIWDLNDGTVLDGPFMPSDRGEITCLRFSDDGMRLAAGGDFGIAVWSLSGSRRMVALIEPDQYSYPTGVRFSPTGDTVLSSPPELWSIPEEASLDDIFDDRYSFTVAAYVQTNGRMIVGGRSGLYLFEPSSTDTIGHIGNYYIDEDAFSDAVVSEYGISAIGAPRRQSILATGDDGNYIKVWSAFSGSLIAIDSTAGLPLSISFAQTDWFLFAVSTTRGTVEVWRLVHGLE